MVDSARRAADSAVNGRRVLHCVAEAPELPELAIARHARPVLLASARHCFVCPAPLPATGRCWFGLDGCRGGWVLAVFDGVALSLQLIPTIAALPETEPGLGCIDMPIGLTSHGQPRHCDMLARQLLAASGRSSSVFPAPGRCCLPLADHTAASAAQRSGGGPGLSIQSWHLLPKIRELDRWLQADHRRRQWLVECHPELAFLRLQQRTAGGSVMARLAGKRLAVGRQQRRLLLRRHWRWDPSTLLQNALACSRRRDLQPDDVVDALVCLAVALAHRRQHLPLPASRDAAGLPMQIVSFAD